MNSKLFYFKLNLSPRRILSLLLVLEKHSVTSDLIYALEIDLEYVKQNNSVKIPLIKNNSHMVINDVKNNSLTFDFWVKIFAENIFEINRIDIVNSIIEHIKDRKEELLEVIENNNRYEYEIIEVLKNNG